MRSDKRRDRRSGRRVASGSAGRARWQWRPVLTVLEEAVALGEWLQGNFPNLFAGFASKSNSQVASAFEASQLNLTFSQVFATALSIFATDTLLNTGSTSQMLATSDGFHVEAGGSSYKTYNVGSDGSAIGLSNNTSYTLYQIVSAADQNAAGVILQPTVGDCAAKPRDR